MVSVLVFWEKLVRQNPKATSLLEEIHKIYPKNSTASIALGCIYASSGKQTEAQNKLERLAKLEYPTVQEEYGIALINAYLGKPEKSVKILESLSSSKNLNMMVRIKFDPKLDLIREEESLQKIIQQLP